MTLTDPGVAVPERTGVSSVEVRTSTRGTDVVVKVYAGSPLGDIGDQALAEYERLMRAIERQQVKAWTETTKTLGPAHEPIPLERS
jgi:hypothetical protein